MLESGIFGGLAALIGFIIAFLALKFLKGATTEEIFAQHSKAFYLIMGGVMMICYIAKAAIL